MKKVEAETAIRHLCGLWGRERGINPGSAIQPSFSDFCSWLDIGGFGHYLHFRSVRGARADAELWFDEEFRQTWRN